MTGHFVDDIRSEALRHAALAAYQDIVTLREPDCACLEFLMLGPLVAHDRILMPLSNDGESVSMVIGAIMRRRFTARQRERASNHRRLHALTPETSVVDR